MVTAEVTLPNGPVGGVHSSISHSPHEWLVRCSHGRVHPGMAWTGTQEVRTPPHGYRAEWCRHAEQGASRWFAAQHCRRADARPIIPGGRPTGLLGSGELRCQKHEKSASSRAECGTQQCYWTFGASTQSTSNLTGGQATCLRHGLRLLRAC